MGHMSVILSLITAAVISLAVAQQIGDTDEVSLVFSIFREASRNPTNVDKFINSPAFGGRFRQDEPWRRGLGRLNKLGKQQAFAFGQFLRRRYARFFTSNANDDILDFEIVKAFSATSACNQATMQLVLAGIFPATDDLPWNSFNSTGLWQPYIYAVNDRLTASTNATCPELKRIYDTLKDDITPAAQQWLAEDHRVSTMFTERTSLNASLRQLAEFAEFIQILQSHNTTLPSWLLETDKGPVTFPPALADVAQSFNLSTTGPNGSSLLLNTPPEPWATKFLRFRHAHAQLCANDTECRRLAAGYFLNHLLETLMLKREDKLPKRKLNLYSSSPETLAAVAALLQTRNFDGDRRPAPVTPLSGLLIEYRDNPQPSVRILAHELGPDGFGDGQARVLTTLLDTTYCSKQDWCRLDVLIKSVGLDTFDDWDKLCKTGEEPTKPCTSAAGGTNIALIRDALADQENAAIPTENGKKLKSTECAFEWDKSGTRPCRNWASHGYCNLYDSVRWLFCRRTCLCNPEFL